MGDISPAVGTPAIDSAETVDGPTYKYMHYTLADDRKVIIAYRDVTSELIAANRVWPRRDSNGNLDVTVYTIGAAIRVPNASVFRKGGQTTPRSITQGLTNKRLREIATARCETAFTRKMNVREAPRPWGRVATALPLNRQLYCTVTMTGTDGTITNLRTRFWNAIALQVQATSRTPGLSLSPVYNQQDALAVFSDCYWDSNRGSRGAGLRKLPPVVIQESMAAIDIAVGVITHNLMEMLKVAGTTSPDGIALARDIRHFATRMLVARVETDARRLANFANDALAARLEPAELVSDDENSEDDEDAPLDICVTTLEVATPVTADTETDSASVTPTDIVDTGSTGATEETAEDSETTVAL